MKDRSNKDGTVWDSIAQTGISRQLLNDDLRKPGTSQNIGGSFNKNKVSINGSEIRTLRSTLKSKKESTSTKNTRFIATAGNLGFGS